MGDSESHRLAADVQSRPTGVVVCLVGDLDATTSTRFLGAAEQAFACDSVKVLVVDADGLAFCDSVGVSTLVRVRQRCDDYGWTFRVVRVQPYVWRVLELLGLVEYLNVE
jgi:anti-sigma B factor antagonist